MAIFKTFRLSAMSWHSTSIVIVELIILFIVFISLLRFHSPSSVSAASERELRRLRYAAFGDSWASGVNYGPPNEDLEYDFPNDDEVCRCRRVNEAYAVQLTHDPDSSWRAGRAVDLDFQACHGSFYGTIPDQVARLNKSWFEDGIGGRKGPDFATLMIGGNDAGFQAIVENCIYQFNPTRDYGPEFPHPDSVCTQTLAHSREVIRSDEFKIALVDAINAVMNIEGVWSNPHFRLYVLSYAGLFNHDDTACDAWSFGVWPGKKPLLTRQLRRAINQVIDLGREAYEHVINHVMFNPKVRYLDINALFDGKRFCEETTEGTIEEMRNRAWLWSLEWPGCLPFVREGDWSREEDAMVSRQLPELCRNCGAIWELGELQRPFHPKGEAHTAIKNFLKACILHEQPYIVDTI